MKKRKSGLVIVRDPLPLLMSRVRTGTPYSRGKVLGPQDRLRRDAIGEKLERFRKNSLEIRRETGTESGPFILKDWMR